MVMDSENYHEDDIVISGISGAFPNSENFEEFKENLLKGIDMISINNRNDDNILRGSVKTIDRFDHTFFHINHHQAEGMTISLRILLEKTFEAVLDAGYNLQQLKGRNIAVVGGVWEGSTDGDPAFNLDVEKYQANLGAAHFMCANKISNWLDLHGKNINSQPHYSTGPSCGVNTACSSSMYALDMAIKYIQTENCEGAIVCSPNFSFSGDGFLRWSLIHSSKISSPFDAQAGGYIRSEAVVVMFIQRRKYARRIYANIIHSATNCDGFKVEGISHPSVIHQKQLFEKFYKTINIDPRSVSYIEAHGTGTQVGDIVEGTSIADFFCQGRETPLKLGSVKSNIGHTESVAALCSIAKLIVAFESGIIPPNLHFTTPNPNIKGLLNGQLQVVTEPTPLEGKYFALNSFGIGGANGHLLLSPHNKIKQPKKCRQDDIPLILAISGRTAEAVDCIFNDIEKNYHDEEYAALLHEIFSDDISGHLQRGFIILHENNKDHVKSKTFFSGDKRPIWFVFTGMGCQWPAMAKSLMRMPIFAKSIEKSHQVLKSKQLDLIKIITDDDPTTFDNILNSFVGIAAVQIALVDILQAIGIQPDGIIGHSVGELGCAYADECFTAEQMILAAYYRGLVSVQTELIHGTMAAVGIGYEKLKEMIADEIDIACHNSTTSCTISGPTPSVENFIETLKEKDIFVRQVNTSNIAYHSRHITPMSEKLLLLLQNEVIPEPKHRSKKWICTSAPENEWEKDNVKFSSAEYHTNNLLNPVFFEEGCRHVPENAIVIEIAPHGLLQAILKRSLPQTVTNIPLTLKNHENGVEFLLNSLGRMYEAGCVPKLRVLYPPVEFPVSRSTPTISSLIKWQHDEQWSVGKLQKDFCIEREYKIRTIDDEYKFIQDHVIDGRNLYPGLGYLWLVIQTVTSTNNKKKTRMPVVLENVRLERATIIPKKGVLKLLVSITAGNKYFNVTENGQVLASGTIRVLENVDKEMINITSVHVDNISESDDIYLSTKDFYKELRLRGYQYKKSFKQVARVNSEGTYGEIHWNDNFSTFMDNMAQIQILSVDTRELLIPTFVRKIVIDFEKHYQQIESLDKDKPKFPVHFYPKHRLVSSGGIQMIGWSCKAIIRQKNLAEPVLETYQFVPYIKDEEMELNQAIHTCTYIALANTLDVQVKTYELLDHENGEKLEIMSSVIWKSLNSVPLVQPNVTILMSSDQKTEIQVPSGITISNEKLPKDKSSTLIVLSNVGNKMDVLEDIREALKDNGFLITKEPIVEDITLYKKLGFNVCFSRKINASEKLLLLNKLVISESLYKAVRIDSDSYAWISNIQTELASIDPERNEKLIVYAEKDPKSGILGLFNSLRREEKGMNLRCIYAMDEKMVDFSMHHSFYKTQLDNDLCQNVYKNEEWGAYCHIEMQHFHHVEEAHSLCTQEERGNLSSFKWIERSSDFHKIGKEKKSIHVYYNSLNFRDIMITSGRISAEDLPLYSRLSECHHGFEFSGKDDDGSRWMGVTEREALATIVEPLANMTYKVPDYMTLEEAATIPAIYTTVIMALFFKMNLQKGCSVLIHAGSGGIGQAAINICLHYECEIFTTVGTPEKVDFIRKTFPQIPESHIGNSRSTSFEHLIIQQTNGRGVDVVLNSLSEEKMHASLRCLADCGHFLEIGKYDMLQKHFLNLEHFINNITYHSVQMDSIMRRSDFMTPAVHDKVAELLRQGAIKPIHRTVFQADEVESAFRFMASGKHIGKVLIKMNDEKNDVEGKTTLIPRICEPQVHCTAHSVYVIAGGLGGMGMELADWLILRGARNIVISSRKGITNGYQSYRIKLWRSYGVNIEIFTKDVTKEIWTRDLLQTANTLGPVEGIFNLAMVLKDDPFYKQTEENFSLSSGPKAILTMHLDKLSRKMCLNLKYFVVFSSAACGLGNQDQSSYAYANSIMERICEIRHSDNLPSLAIQWGAVGDVGTVAEFQEQIEGPEILICGALQQKMKSCLATLNKFMKQSSHPIVTSVVLPEKHHCNTDIITAVANILGIKDLKTINQSWTFPELGMDSILGMELKQILEAEFNVIFTPEDLQIMTFVKLQQMKEEKENSLKKPGKKRRTLMQIFMDEIILNKPVRRIPIDEDHIEKDIVFDESPTIFMFPGIEGLAVTMQSLAKNLPAQVICFQYYFGEVANFTLEELCDYFVKYILENFNLDQELCIIGHSFGGVLALEVADKLEKQGKKGYLYLIECSVRVLHQVQTREDVKQNYFDDEQIQVKVCSSVVSTLSPTMPIEKFTQSLQNIDSWQSKKNLCLSLLSSSSTNKNTMDLLLDRIYTVSKALLRDHRIPTVTLESSGILIRCIENTFDDDETYGLSEYFKNPVQIHKIDASHNTIMYHAKTSEILMESPLWKK